MTVKWGSTTCTVIKWGGTNCTAVYWGSTKVFPDTLTWYVYFTDSWYGNSTCTFVTAPNKTFQNLVGTTASSGTDPWLKGTVALYESTSGGFINYAQVKMTASSGTWTTSYLHSSNSNTSSNAIQKTSSPSNGVTYYTFISH